MPLTIRVGLLGIMLQLLRVPHLVFEPFSCLTCLHHSVLRQWGVIRSLSSPHPSIVDVVQPLTMSDDEYTLSRTTIFSSTLSHCIETVTTFTF